MERPYTDQVLTNTTKYEHGFYKREGSYLIASLSSELKVYRLEYLPRGLDYDLTDLVVKTTEETTILVKVKVREWSNKVVSFST